MATATIRNGTNVDQLIQTIGAIQQDPGLAKMTFKATTHWKHGTHSEAVIGGFVHAGNDDTSRTPGQFVVTGDEPPVLLGQNLGPNAVEYCLAALGFCYAVGYVANASAKGIDIEELSYNVEGDIDLQAFLGLANGRAGFTEIRVKGQVKASNASPKDLQELSQYVAATSPVGDILANPVRITAEFQTTP